jgi:hypothetical protein
MRIAFFVFVAVGYVVAFAPARRCHLDIGRFRRSLWVGIGRRDHWLLGLRVSYLVFGWPALVVVLVWRTSPTREALVGLRSQMRGRQHTAAPSGSVS